MSGTGPVTGTQTVERALEVLLAIGASGKTGLTLAECSARLGFSKATTQRILKTLAARGFLEPVPETGAYRLGVANLWLGTDYLESLEIRDVALPQLRILAANTRETVHLGLLSGSRVVYVEKVESPQAVRMFSRVGDTMPAHSTGVGKAMLAFLPTAVTVQLLPDELDRCTPATITDRDALLLDLDATRLRGYAIDDIENEDGIRCVGTPVFDHTGGVVAAISVAGPEARVTRDKVEELGRLAQRASLAVSERLGYRGLVTEAMR